MPPLVVHDPWDECLLEEGMQKIDLPNQDKIVQRTGVGDDDPRRRSESSAPKIFPVVIKVIDRIWNIDLVGFEEGIERLTRWQPEQAAQFGLRQSSCSELLDGQRLEGTARKIAAGSKTGRQIVGNMNGHVHGDNFMRACRGRQSARWRARRCAPWTDCVRKPGRHGRCALVLQCVDLCPPHLPSWPNQVYGPRPNC
jgi:hypothetical protein